MSAASTALAPPADAFTLADFLRVVLARRHFILRIAAGFVFLVAIGLLAMPTRYSTSAEITIDPRKNNITEPSAVMSALPTDAPSLQNQIRILASRDLAAQVILALKLYDDPEFNPSLQTTLLSALDPRRWANALDTPARQRDAVINAFLSRVSVDTIGLSTSLGVTFTADDPEKAARIANQIADTYVVNQLRAKDEATRATAYWLELRIRDLAREAQAAEAAVETFKSENNLAEAADGTPLVVQQLAAISAQLVQARADLAQKEASYARASGTSGKMSELSQVMASPLIAQLRQQEVQLTRDEALLSTRYGPRHPKMIAMETQKRDLEGKIGAEITRIAGSLGGEVAVGRAQVASLEESLAQAERLAAAQSQLRVKLKALEADAASTRKLYDTFVTRLHETEGQVGLETPDAAVISHAPVPLSPSTPSRALVLAAALPAGLLLGLLIALIGERFAPLVAKMDLRSDVAPAKAVAAVETSLPPVLGEITGAESVHAADLVVDVPNSTFAAQIAGLINGIAPRGAGSRAIVVTSANGAAGRAAIAVALARSAAQSGRKVVLLDGSLRRPEAARLLGLASPQKGLIHVLEGQLPLSRALLRDPQSWALLLAPTAPLKEPERIFATPVFAALLSHLKRSCDLVVIDAPDAKNGDVRALAQFADVAVMIVAKGQIERSASRAAMRSFEGARVPLGLVLTV